MGVEMESDKSGCAKKRLGSSMQRELAAASVQQRRGQDLEEAAKHGTELVPSADDAAPLIKWPSSEDMTMFREQLARADQASEKQMEMDLEHQRQMILPAMGTRGHNDHCTHGGQSRVPLTIEASGL